MIGMLAGGLSGAAGMAGMGGMGGAGGFALSGQSSAGGDDTFNHDFNYRTGGGESMNGMLVLGGALILAALIIGRK